MKKVMTTPEYKAKLKAAMLEVFARPEMKAVLNAAGKAKWANPQFRAKVIDSITRFSNQPEERLRRRNRTIENWKNPRIRANRLLPGMKRQLIKLLNEGAALTKGKRTK